MPPTLTCAIAENFVHTAEAFDLRASFVTGSVDVNAVVATGTYRMCLAPSASDFIRAMEAALNAALALAVRTETVTCSLSAAGIFSITISDASDFLKFNLSSALRARLGFTGAPASGATATGSYPVWHLATFAERVSADWQQRTAVASAETAGGVGYGVTSGITRWQDELTFGFIPRDPTFGTSLGVSQTPWEPDAAYLTALGTVGARAYSVSDLLSTAMGKTCAFAAGNFQALRTSTTERYHLVTIPGRECGAPRLARLRAGWDAYRRWTTALIRQSTPTGTRA